MRLSGTKTSTVSSSKGLGDQLYDLGGARPTLDLNFANNESLVDSITGKTLVSHVRASSATYVDGDGLIKTTPVNLLTYSEELDNAGWTKERTTVTSNAILAPDGTNTADLLVEDTATGTHSCKQTESLTSGVSYVLSAHVKANSLDHVFLDIFDTSFTVKAASFDLTAVTSADIIRPVKVKNARQFSKLHSLSSTPKQML